MIEEALDPDTISSSANYRPMTLGKLLYLCASRWLLGGVRELPLEWYLELKEEHAIL